MTAAEKWASHPDLFERYLRMFHRTTAIEWYDGRHGGGDCVYVTFDTADRSAHFDLSDHIASLIDLSEWRAYCEGDVYGYIVEERATWQRTNAAGEVVDTRETWEPGRFLLGLLRPPVRRDGRSSALTFKDHRVR